AGLHPRAEGAVVRQLDRRAEINDRDSVGVDQRRVDAIARGAAHQSDGPHCRPLCWLRTHGIPPVYALPADVLHHRPTKASRQKYRMSTPKSEFLKVIQDRGYLHQSTDWEGLDALMAKQSVTAYIGFDATADSLHVGSMVQIMLLRRLQQTGHKPIALM